MSRKNRNCFKTFDLYLFLSDVDKCKLLVMYILSYRENCVLFKGRGQHSIIRL